MGDTAFNYLRQPDIIVDSLVPEIGGVLSIEEALKLREQAILKPKGGEEQFILNALASQWRIEIPRSDSPIPQVSTLVETMLSDIVNGNTLHRSFGSLVAHALNCAPPPLAEGTLEDYRSNRLAYLAATVCSLRRNPAINPVVISPKNYTRIISTLIAPCNPGLSQSLFENMSFEGDGR